MPKRSLINQGSDFSLISSTNFSNSNSEDHFIMGFSWDMNFLKEHIIRGILEKTTKNSGQKFVLLDSNKKDVLTGNMETEQNRPINLKYHSVSLPWLLVVSNPEIEYFEKTARREIVTYAILLFLVISLMIFGIVLVFRDIAREAETSRLKTEFVHNISHELKTPLTLIRLYGETLERKKNLSNEEKKEAYQIITKESERLSHLIDNILDFSRIETGRKEFIFKKGNLTKIVQDIFDSYSYHFDKKGFVVQADISSDLPEMIFDQEAIANVIINLFSNAIKFSQSRKELGVLLFAKNGNAVLQVSDKGIGIPKKEITEIFQRFYRSDDPRVSETKGSGLGLTLAKHIVEAHNGRIEVKSEPGQGSIFSVILPLSNLKSDKK